MLPLPLRTDRLVIDRLVPADASALAAYRSDPEVARYQSWDPPYPVAQAEALIAADAGDEAGAPGSSVNLAVRHQGTLAGDVYVAVPVDGPAEVGVTLAPAFQGRGLAAEAVGRVVQELVRSATVSEVQAIIDTRNAPSLALFERLGFRRVEVLPAEPGGAPEVRLTLPAGGAH